MDEFLPDQPEQDPGFMPISSAKKDYPLGPAGFHPVTISRVKRTEKHNKEKNITEPAIQVTFDYDEPGYQDDEGNMRPYRVFSRKMTLKTGEKASLRQFCLDLTGLEPVIEDIDGQKVFRYDRLVGMSTQVLVKHNPAKDGSTVYANITAFDTSPAMLEHNRAKLPGNEPVAKAAAKPAPKVKKAEEATETPVVADPNLTSEVMVLAKIAEAKNRAELENIHAVIIDPAYLGTDVEAKWQERYHAMAA